MNSCVIILLVAFFTIVPSLLGIEATERLLSTLLTVASIFLSIGLSLIVGFDFDKIKNATVHKRIKKNINGIKVRFICLFIIDVIIYLFSLQIVDGNLLSLTSRYPALPNPESMLYSMLTNFAMSVILISTVYFMINFNEIQRLKDDINEQARAANR